jgi:hypothetical protein
VTRREKCVFSGGVARVIPFKAIGRVCMSPVDIGSSNSLFVIGRSLDHVEEGVDQALEALPYRHWRMGAGGESIS